MRHGLAAALGLLLALALAAPAPAAVTGSYDPATDVLTVTMTAGGDVGGVVRQGTNIGVIGDDTISGGTPTVTNTATVHFVDSSGAGTTAVIDHSGGRFEPGSGAEVDASDEIEFFFDMGGGNDVARLVLDPAGQQVAIGNTGINFNPLEDTPKDDDVDGDLASVESIEVRGGAGNDTITGSSTGAGVDTSTKPLTITGGGGDDDLTGGNGPDQINGQDGDNNDVISCRDGADSATADFLDAVGNDCESITRPSSGGGGGTGTPPPAGNTTPPRPRLSPGRLVFRRRRIGVPVTCQASSSRQCRGTVTLRRRGRILGRGRYAAAPGRRVVVTVRINARGVRLFLSRARTRVSLRITAVGGGSVQRSVVVRSPGVR